MEEHLPRYRLKQDYLAQHGGPQHEDWTLRTPALTPAPTQLSPEQAGCLKGLPSGHSANRVCPFVIAHAAFVVVCGGHVLVLTPPSTPVAV